jgi:hypothetical protein
MSGMWICFDIVEMVVYVILCTRCSEKVICFVIHSRLHPMNDPFLTVSRLFRDITTHPFPNRWLDRFVTMKEKWIKDAKGWGEYFAAKYPVCGRLDKWDEDTSQWAELSPEDLEALEKGCCIM